MLDFIKGLADKIGSFFSGPDANAAFARLGEFRQGGQTAPLAESVLNGMLVLVAVALFVAAAVLLVQRFVGSNKDLVDQSYPIKRVFTMACIVFTIVLIARAGVGLAQDFASSGSGGPLGSTVSDDYLESAGAMPYVTDSQGNERSYLDIARKPG